MGSRSEDEKRRFQVTLSPEQVLALETMHAIDKTQGGNKTREELIAESVDEALWARLKKPEYQAAARQLMANVLFVAEILPGFLPEASTDIVDRGKKGPNPNTGPLPPSR